MFNSPVSLETEYRFVCMCSSLVCRVYLLSNFRFNLFNVQGPVFLLEDGESAISLNDALMWAKVNPFSPLGTGLRINPF